MSKLSESSDDGDEEEDGNGAKDINSDGNGGADRNNGAVGGYVEWLSFLSTGAQTEALGAMEKAKASSSIASRKNRIWEKVRLK